jgi:hypothetical protein
VNHRPHRIVITTKKKILEEQIAKKLQLQLFVQARVVPGRLKLHLVTAANIFTGLCRRLVTSLMFG